MKEGSWRSDFISTCVSFLVSPLPLLRGWHFKAGVPLRDLFALLQSSLYSMRSNGSTSGDCFGFVGLYFLLGFALRVMRYVMSAARRGASDDSTET